MAGKRRRFSGEFKARVVRAALREDKSLAELASQFRVHPNQITEWKRQVIEAMPELFGRQRKGADAKAAQEHEDRLYRQIGQLQVELDWVKKKAEELGLDS